MAVVKARIDNYIYDVVSLAEYNSNPNLYRGQFVAVDLHDGYLYPLRNNPNDQRPGMIDVGQAQFFNRPMGNQCPMYSSQNIIDFSKASSTKDVIEAQAKLAKEEKAILTSIDNIFTPPTSPDDTPEMSLLKEAITKKHIDIDKYEQRFGSNYNNDKRLLKKNNITFGKMRNVCRNLDIKATLVLEDKNGDVPNPMNDRIQICLTDGFEGDDEVDK